MANIIKCPACNRPIVDDSYDCRHCGTETSFGRWKRMIQTPMIWVVAAASLVITVIWFWGPSLA